MSRPVLPEGSASPVESRNERTAFPLTVRRLPWLAVAAVIVVAVVWVVQSRHDANRIDPELTARTMLQNELDEKAPGATVADVSCVSEPDRRFECVVDVAEADGSSSRVGGTLVCDQPGDGAQCLWRGQLAGG